MVYRSGCNGRCRSELALAYPDRRSSRATLGIHNECAGRSWCCVAELEGEPSRERISSQRQPLQQVRQTLKFDLGSGVEVVDASDDRRDVWTLGFFD